MIQARTEQRQGKDGGNSTEGHRRTRWLTGVSLVIHPAFLPAQGISTLLDNGTWLLTSSWCLGDKCSELPSQPDSSSSQWQAVRPETLPTRSLISQTKPRGPETYNTSRAATDFLRQSGALQLLPEMERDQQTLCLSLSLIHVADRGWKAGRKPRTLLGHFQYYYTPPNPSTALPLSLPSFLDMNYKSPVHSVLHRKLEMP